MASPLWQPCEAGLAAIGPDGSPGDSPSVVCKQDGKVVWLNAAWTRLCGYTREEMMDRSLKVLQGPATDQQAVQTLMHHVHEKKPCRVPALVNYDRSGRPFRHTLNVVPLPAPDGSSCLFRATSEVVEMLRPSQSILSTIDAPLSVLEARESLADAIPTSAFAPQKQQQQQQQQQDGACGGVPPEMGRDVEVLTQPQPPYAIAWASEGWLDLCGFSSAEVVGRTLALIQGPATDRTQVARLMAAVRGLGVVEGVELVNYDKKRRPFKHVLSVQPVRSRMGPMLRARSLHVEQPVERAACPA
jgi:PAS domain S-box-containing protein